VGRTMVHSRGTDDGGLLLVVIGQRSGQHALHQQPQRRRHERARVAGAQRGLHDQPTGAGLLHGTNHRAGHDGPVAARTLRPADGDDDGVRPGAGTAHHGWVGRITGDRPHAVGRCPAA